MERSGSDGFVIVPNIYNYSPNWVKSQVAIGGPNRGVGCTCPHVVANLEGTGLAAQSRFNPKAHVVSSLGGIVRRWNVWYNSLWTCRLSTVKGGGAGVQIRGLGSSPRSHFFVPPVRWTVTRPRKVGACALKLFGPTERTAPMTQDFGRCLPSSKAFRPKPPRQESSAQKG
jgi:hypothetical protein